LGKIIQALGKSNTSAWENWTRACKIYKRLENIQALRKYTSSLENIQVPGNYDWC
jgi:hypothetical protein